VQSLLAATSLHGVVHAANCPFEIWQLKQVSPAAQGPPHAGTNVVQTPCRQVTPTDMLFLIAEPSSVVVGPVAQVHDGQLDLHCVSRLVYCVCAVVRRPMYWIRPQQSAMFIAAKQSASVVHDRSSV
jgi:hypothetical protein